jgi:hypothetical protein
MNDWICGRMVGCIRGFMVHASKIEIYENLLFDRMQQPSCLSESGVKYIVRCKYNHGIKWAYFCCFHSVRKPHQVRDKLLTFPEQCFSLLPPFVPTVVTVLNYLFHFKSTSPPCAAYITSPRLSVR